MMGSWHSTTGEVGEASYLPDVFHGVQVKVMC